MRNKEIGVGPFGCAGLQQQLLERDCALGHAPGVLDHQHVARHELRPGHAGELIVRKVPGLHTKQHAQRTAFHVRLAHLGVQLGRRQKGRRVLGVIGQNVAAVLHLATGLANALAHLQGSQLGKLVQVGMHQSGGLVEDAGTLRKTGVFPGLKTSLGLGQRLVKLDVGHGVERLEKLAIGGIDTLISHGVIYFLSSALSERLPW